MGSITETFTAHHKDCDDLWADAERFAIDLKWDEARKSLDRFARALTVHLQVEENVLFPAFEGATGMRGGPTAVMRSEHEQLRALLQSLEAAVSAQDIDAFQGAAETLLILMQQHNLKEEQMLYPMCDEAVGSDARLLGRLEEDLQA